MKSEVFLSPWRAHSSVYRIYTSENWGCFISCIRMHWWRSIAACRAQTCWVYLSLVVFLMWQEHSTALERNPNVLTGLHHLHLFARQGQVPWTASLVMERILSKVHWLEEPGQAGPGGFSTPGTAAQCLWLLALPSSLVHLGHGLPRLLRQPRRVRQDRGAPAQVPQGVQHHYNEKKKAGKHQEKLWIWYFSYKREHPLTAINVN